MESKIENTGTVVKTLTSADSGIVEILNTQTLFQPYQGLDTAFYVGRKFQIEKLQITCALTNSLEEASIPDIAPEDTNAERALKMSLTERTSEQLGLAVFRSISGGAWLREALPKMFNYGFEQSIPLLQPYITFTEVELLGTNDKLGVQVVGFGGKTLKSGDYITVKASWSQVISFVPRESGILKSTVPISTPVSPTQKTLIAPSRSGRRVAVLQNVGNERVWFLPTDNSGQVAIGDSLYLDPGGYTSIVFDNWIMDKPIWGIAEGAGGKVNGFEAIAP